MKAAALTWLTLAAFMLYIVYDDPNAYPWLVLQIERFKLFLRMRWFLIRHNPRTPWVQWEINRSANRIAKMLKEEQEGKTK